MRVLQVIDSLQLGGAEMLLRDLVPRFKAHGVDCSVLTLRPGPTPIADDLRRVGVEVRETGNLGLYSPLQIRALYRAMRGFDIVHVHLFPAQLWAVLAGATAQNCTLMTTEHSTSNRRRGWLGLVDAWMYSHFAQICCVSEAAAAELARCYPSIKEKLVVIPNGIVLENFAATRPGKLPHTPPGMVRAVFVGRLAREKDHATMLRALALAPRIYLFIAGDGPLRAQLQQQARALGVADRVTFLGFRNDVAGVLKACDIYVHSAVMEGFGLAACEAMAAGLPVIASDVPGLADVVRGTGALFPQGDADVLARQLNLLANSVETRSRMAEASRRRAADFDINRTVNHYIRLYEQLATASEKRVVAV